MLRRDTALIETPLVADAPFYFPLKEEDWPMGSRLCFTGCVADRIMNDYS